MGPMQDAAIQTLVIQGFLDADAFAKDRVVQTDEAIPDHLGQRIRSANATQAPLLEFLCRDLDKIPFGGPKGLKDRTGLGEYRYDVV